jgi:hypothetical protein
MPAFAHSARQSTASIKPLDNGGYAIQGDSYAASVDAHGMLSEFKVRGQNLLAGPFVYADGDPSKPNTIDWKIMAARRTAPDTVELDLVDTNALDESKRVATIAYHALPGSLQFTLHRLANGFGYLSWQLSPDVMAVESLARPGFGFKRLPGTGLVYALPALEKISALRDMRFYLKSPAAGSTPVDANCVDAYYKLAEAPFNRESNGVLQGDRWTRLLINNQEMAFTLQPVLAGAPREGPNAPPVLRRIAPSAPRPVPFALTITNPDGMIPRGESATAHLAFDPNSPPNSALALQWRLTDFWDRPAGEGSAAIQPSDIVKDGYDLSVKPQQISASGYYRLTVSLSSAGSGGLPGQEAADLMLFTPNPLLISPPVRTDWQPAIAGVLGLQCYRFGVLLNLAFPSRERSPLGDPNYRWTDFDSIIDVVARDEKQYRLTPFCQLVNRPRWMSAQDFEDIMKIVVARYKDRCHNWEIENEPTGGGRYTPASYVELALAPAYRAVHALDPQGVVMGPAFTSIKWFWYDPFFAADGARYVDALSTHAYTGSNRSWEEQGMPNLFRRLRSEMEAHGAGKIPIWQTETGFQWDNHADMPKLQAAYVVRMFALGWTLGIPPDHNSYFYISAHGFEPWYLWDRAPNRGGAAARIFAEQTAGMRYESELQMGKYAHAVRLAASGGDCVIVWTDDFPAECAFRLGAGVDPASVGAVNIMGSPVPVTAKGGTIALPVSGYPVYLHLPHGAPLTALSHFPAGTNWALATNGGTAQASSGDAADAARVNDGIWTNDEQDPPPYWIADQNAALPQWASVAFDRPHRIDTVVAVIPTANVGTCAPRDFQIQLDGVSGWRTVADVKGNTTEWAVLRKIAPVEATGIRIVVTAINNGWWRDDPTHYTDMRARVYELEAYGPQ